MRRISLSLDSPRRPASVLFFFFGLNYFKMAKKLCYVCFLVARFRIFLGEKIAIFLYWGLACSQICEGFLRVFTFIPGSIAKYVEDS
jgi:hypothetical protein